MHTIRLTGTVPLLMHNGRLANPMDPYSRAMAQVTSEGRAKKGVKSDAHYEKMARAEFAGGLYDHPEYGIALPGTMFLSALLQAAKKRRLGTQIKLGVTMLTTDAPLTFPGMPKVAPEDMPDALWNAGHYLQAVVKNPGGGGQVVRTRPKIPAGWTTSFDVLLDTEHLNPSTLEEIMNVAGLLGIGDWRPGSPNGGTYGKFTADVVHAVAEAAE